ARGTHLRLVRADLLGRAFDGSAAMRALQVLGRERRHAPRHAEQEQPPVRAKSSVVSLVAPPARSQSPPSRPASWASRQLMSASRAWNDAPCSFMCVNAASLSWHAEQTDAVGEMFRSSVETLLSAPVSIVVGRPLCVSSVE